MVSPAASATALAVALKAMSEYKNARFLQKNARRAAPSGKIRKDGGLGGRKPSPRTNFKF